MGKMKEMFMKQIEEQMNDQALDDAYQYEQYVKSLVDTLNNENAPKFSETDILFALHSVLGDANPCNETIMNELNNLHNLRNGF
jgi:hypothetical protein